jgi:hypothetical protein
MAIVFIVLQFTKNWITQKMKICKQGLSFTGTALLRPLFIINNRPAIEKDGEAKHNKNMNLYITDAATF